MTMKQILLFFIVAITLFGYALRFFNKPFGRPFIRSSLRMTMEMKTLLIPQQTDFLMYSQIVKETFGEDKLVRWYISSFVNGSAVVEAVVEEAGIGKSRVFPPCTAHL